MNLSTISIKRPVLTIVMNITIILFGIIGYTFLGVREFPSIDPAVVSVRTSYSGANADIIESQITEPLEKAINSIDGIRNITSSSVQGSSSISIEFELDKDLEAAANDVRDKVSQSLRSLPEDLDAPPVVSKADADADRIISMTVQSNNKNILELSDYAENVIAQRIETIPGVSGVQIWGQRRYAMRLWIDPLKLASYGLTVADVRAALLAQNIELPSGKLTGDNTELTVKTLGNLNTEEEFNNIIILADGEKLVQLSDIGRASLEGENMETKMSDSGQPMVAVAVIPQPGTNYLEIADAFYEEYEKLQNDLPEDFKLNVVIDDTVFVKKAVTEVAETILISIILVILVIYLFFRNWSLALRPLLDIPVSLIATFFFMWLLGFSVNVLTLLAIVLATGLVVDDGIVVTENIYKKIEEGMNPIEAAVKGSKEIFFAVISISITLAAVFLPVIFLEGFVGRLFREFGVVLGTAVLVSAFVSLTLTPMLNAYLTKPGKQSKSKFYQVTEKYFVAMNESYKSALGKFMQKKWLSFPILIGCLGLIVLFYSLLQKETAPYDDRSFVRLSVTAPEGSSYEYMDKLMNGITELINDSIPEKKVSLILTSPGFGTSSVNSGRANVALVDPSERERSQQEIAQDLGEWAKAYVGGRSNVSERPTISVNRRGGPPIQFIIQAKNFEKLQEKVPEFMAEAEKDPTFSFVDVNLKFNKPEIYVSIDREKAESLGVSVRDVAQTLQLSLSGQRFGYFLMNGKQYQVIGQFDKQDRNDPTDLTSIFVKNDEGQLIQLDNLVTTEEHSSPPQLFHNNRYMSATVSANLAPGKSIGDGIDAMNAIKDRVLDDTFTTDLGGESRDFVESSSNTAFAFGLAFLLIFLILAAQFESFIDPIIIILTVPMAVAGAMFSLWLFGETWNIFSQIGTIMLIGLVTKNGILIVEFANQLQEEDQSLSKMDAIMRASVSRLRPILMTSLTIALGALPIALSLGAASASRTGMGVVIIGGTLFSLVLTLFIIPALYLMWSRKKVIRPEFKNLELSSHGH
ncbi:efflux RND transporter permease subunit [Flagellimonas taeanensis]|jgi:hydrophobe/amphiphile efflux-1 (HAE1) family protein|uniref:Multidrug efflux pump n=1 Tax=Flagellimonas taeanensis TaxID=1005926 RepID=A0A1M6Z3N7_9FLAO|nr:MULTISPECIES: efflux RND transporter permease subunit [Allomuricauda]MDC6386086.1 efflux RND transporter permease subunit [Muricauda sp. SK9]MEE1963689.1 efflux RND transporter permease subunit [Allomuricauda taeanensis]RIV50321.1 efflux RND transporter permease subunit [Allomuricauda taeanensis]SFC12095.1 multidrug efflux pump [Allomuricauda taeanensis]SHL24919.1 hydrophobic/amphiphilic exporter-1, HAE1 family/multidrug efflux pump [Allomuricauda taeanensis]